MFGRGGSLADRVQEGEGVVVFIPQHIIPAVSFERQFDTALVDDAFPHLRLTQSFYLRAARQSGTFAHLVERFFRFRRTTQFIERFGFHEQHIGIAADDPVLIGGVIVRRLRFGEQELTDIIARCRPCTAVGITVEGRTAGVEDGEVLTQVTRLILTDELRRRLIPSVASCRHT